MYLPESSDVKSREEMITCCLTCRNVTDSIPSMLLAAAVKSRLTSSPKLKLPSSGVSPIFIRPIRLDCIASWVEKRSIWLTVDSTCLLIWFMAKNEERFTSDSTKRPPNA